MIYTSHIQNQELIEENDNNYTNNANTLLHTIGSSYNLDVLETLGLTSLVKEEYANTLFELRKAKMVQNIKYYGYDTLKGYN